MTKVPGGYKIGRLEFYIISLGKSTFKERLSSLGFYKGSCGCYFLELYYIGFTLLNRECTPEDN